MELHQTKLAAEQTELRLKQVEGEARAREDHLQQLKCKVDNRWSVVREGLSRILLCDHNNTAQTRTERSSSNNI